MVPDLMVPDLMVMASPATWCHADRPGRGAAIDDGPG
jgi:hypothetical protein